MNILAGIDTTKVYQEFKFSRDQVKDLKCEQWFLHVDLKNWMEEELNRRTDWNAIKILYEQIHHFDFNYVKCLEFYYENDFDDKMATFISNARYKMPWKSETSYYVKHDSGLIDTPVDKRLLRYNLQKYLIKSYEMKVNWMFERSVTVYEFKHDLNHDQKLKLDDVFKFVNGTYPVFISDQFLYLRSIEPPIIMETEILLPFHGEFLADLNTEDIIAMELAIKDHRLPFYDRDLDHDIQMQLQVRLPMFYENKKLKIYYVNEFINLTTLKYFIYKYRHCFTKLVLPMLDDYQMLNDEGADLFEHEIKNLKFDILENTNLRVNVISNGNINVCSLTYRASMKPLTDHSEEIVRSSTKYIHLNSDMNFNLDDLKFLQMQLRSLSSSYKYNHFQILIRTNFVPATLSVLIHKLLEQIKSDTITIRLIPLNHHINNSILNMFFNRPIDCNMEFKKITFHLQSVMKWLSKAKNIISVEFIDCRILLKTGRRTILGMQNNITRLNPKLKLKFRNMNIDGLLPITCQMIAFENCHIIPSIWSALSTTTFDTVRFKNMRINMNTIVSLKHKFLELDNCQIESRQDIVLKRYTTTESVSGSSVRFHKMDIDFEAFMKIVDSKSSVIISNSRILCLSNEIVELYSNYPVNKIKITFIDMNIELNTLYNVIFYKFNDVSFGNCSILCTDNFMPNISIEIEYLRFHRMLITPEIIKNLKYFKVKTPIQFQYCELTNQILLEIWRRKRCQRLIVKGSDKIDGYCCLEFIALFYENRLDQLHLQFKDGSYFPFENFIEIDWWDLPFRNINWSKLKIRSVLVNDSTIKLEYLQNDLVIDLFFELNQLPNDSDICNVNYS